MTEKVLRKGNLLEAAVLLERDIKDRPENTSTEAVRIRHMIIGILPYVKRTKLNLDASSVTSAYSGTEVDSPPNKKPKKTGGKGSN